MTSTACPAMTLVLGDMQNGLNSNQIGPSAGHPLPMNDADAGGLWHDKWFATTRFGPARAVGDAALAARTVLSVVNIGPTSNAGPVVPSLMTAVGITVAAPVHFIGINP